MSPTKENGACLTAVRLLSILAPEQCSQCTSRVIRADAKWSAGCKYINAHVRESVRGWPDGVTTSDIIMNICYILLSFNCWESGHASYREWTC